jgi:hypothetical protein
MLRISIDQDHQIIGESRLFDVGVLAIAGGLFRSLQHFIYLGKIEIAK